VDELEYELEHARATASERDSVNRLYYGMWIVFLGGFALSLHVVDYRHPRLAVYLVISFRLLAIAGTAVNFWMQYHAIKGLSNWRVSLFHRALNNDAGRDRAERAMQRSDRIVIRCELPLRIIAAAFLVIAFLGSFLVRIP